MFKNIYYKFLTWLFYQIGDTICHFKYEWCYKLYQKTMQLSYKYDERLGFWLWKEPS